jgi:hypothetical protein
VNEREGCGRLERVRAPWEMNARAAAAPREVFDHGLFKVIEEDTARGGAPPARSAATPTAPDRGSSMGVNIVVDRRYGEPDVRASHVTPQGP